MQLLCLASLVMLVCSSHQLLVDNGAAPATEDYVDDFLIYPIQPVNIRKREVASQGTHADHDAFVEEKLIQHSQVLEHLLRMMTKSSSITKRLLEHMSGNVEKPPMPEEIQVTYNTRRSLKNEASVRDENQFARLGRIIPLYGNYVKNLAVKELSTDSEPQFTRRSSGGKFESVPTTKPPSESPWCALTILCQRTLDPVCAFDDNFGYGRFYDLCHMFQVNCYWKYNFSVVKDCKPSE